LRKTSCLPFGRTPEPISSKTRSERGCVITPFCHCERSRLSGRAWQSRRQKRLLRSLRFLAMTLRHSLCRSATPFKLVFTGTSPRATTRVAPTRPIYWLEWGFWEGFSVKIVYGSWALMTGGRDIFSLSWFEVGRLTSNPFSSAFR